MPRGSYLSAGEKEKIDKLNIRGLTGHNIARKINRSSNAVYCYLRNKKKRGLFVRKIKRRTIFTKSSKSDTQSSRVRRVKQRIARKSSTSRVRRKKNVWKPPPPPQPPPSPLTETIESNEMDIFFPYTFRERAAFKESAIKCGFVELIAESTANVGVLAGDERMSILLMAWKNIGDYLTKHPYNEDVGVTVSWVGRCTLDLWFGREWIACAIDNKTALIEQMMKVYPTAFVTMHPYSWPYMFSIYRDPWMVEYLNINFQRMSGPDLNPVLEPRDSEFIQQEGLPLMILRMVNMFDFRMVKLVKYICLRLLLTWQDVDSLASRTLRASPNAEKYIDYARHIYLLAICEGNGLKDLHYTLETIQRNVHCNPILTGSLELGANAIAKGLLESNKSLTEMLIAFLFKIPKLQFVNIFGGALSKYVNFLTEYQLRKLSCLSSIKLSWPHEEVYSKLVQMFITHRESSEALIKATPKISEKIFSKVHNLAASKCAYELIKLRPHPEWHTTKITLLLIIIGEEVNIIQDYKYNDVQSTDELIEKEKEVAIYYRDLAKLFHKTPYLEQEAWLTTFSLHPCREFLDAVTRCGAKNLRAIKKQAHKLKVIEVPDTKTKIKEEDQTNIEIEEKKIMPQEMAIQNITSTELDPPLPVTSTACLKPELETVPSTSAFQPDLSLGVIKTKPKRIRKKPDKNAPKKIEPKIKDEPKDKTNETQLFIPPKRGRPVGAVSKNPRPRSGNPVRRGPFRKPDEKPDVAEEMFAAAAGAADNIINQTEETIKYPAFALMNSVTDTEDLMKCTNYNEAYEQYEELNRILLSVKLSHTFHEDLLTLLIAPRYKRLTWAISWKKLKKRCRVILTKVNKKRELVEQSMADANDRLTHLNIDYEKYKDKPQIDYGTIEGGYECFDNTDSDDDGLKIPGGKVINPKLRPAVKRRAKKLFGTSKQFLKFEQMANLDIKPILKVENLDSSTSNLFNIFDSTHLSKPVYLNKPVYFVRNPLASPLKDTAISLDTEIDQKPLIGNFSRRSTGEETAASDSLEEHHWQLITTQTLNPIIPDIRRKSQEQRTNVSQFKPISLSPRSLLKTESTFNIPASIKQQLEQPTMFFKVTPKKEDVCKQEEPDNIDNRLSSSTQSSQLSSAPNQTDSTSNEIARFSPKLFEDMPEDLTVRKLTSNIDLGESTPALEVVPPNVPSQLLTQNQAIATPVANSSNEAIQPVKKPPRKRTKQPAKPVTKPNSRKRQAKRDGKPSAIKEEGQPDSKIERQNTAPSSGLSKVRIVPQNKNSKATKINPKAAVVFSSAAASYHRTPYLNAAQEEPKILQQLLSKEITPCGGVDGQLGATTVPSTLEVQNSNNATNNTSIHSPSFFENAEEFQNAHKAISSNALKNSRNTQNSKCLGVNGSYTASIDKVSEGTIITPGCSASNDCEIETFPKPTTSTEILTNLNSLTTSNAATAEFEFKVPAAVVKPCFFMRSKPKKIKYYVSDWVRNIKFYEKTAEVIIPDKENIMLSSQAKPADVLYDNRIVLNTKLLDPHLKTYKNTKASFKATDTKRFEEYFSDTDKFLSENSDESDELSSSLMDIEKKPKIETGENIALRQSENSSDSLVGQATTSSAERKSPSPVASTSKQFVHTKRKLLESGSQKPEVVPSEPKKRIRKPNPPSTVRLDKMCKLIERIMKASQEPVPETDNSGKFFNLFAVQLMHQTKSVHFNNEYLQEKVKLLAAYEARGQGVSYEPSILTACPGPSADCVKLIKALKKKKVFKGVDMSSNQISFTSTLAKELLGSVIKISLNSDTSGNVDGFDASDALDDFTRSRREANSPTLYSPTLSFKHLENGTLPDSVGSIDTSPEIILPKPRRKRSSMAKDLPATSTPVKRRTRKRKTDDTKISNQDNPQLVGETNQLPPKEVSSSECSTGNYSSDVLISMQTDLNISTDYSTTGSFSEESIQPLEVAESPPKVLPQEHLSAEQNKPLEINTPLVLTTEETSVHDVAMETTIEKNLVDICKSNTDTSDVINDVSDEKIINIDSKSNDSVELKSEIELPVGASAEGNSTYSNFKKPLIKDLPKRRIRGKPIQNEKKTSSHHRTRRHTIDGTKGLGEKATSILFSEEKRQTENEKLGVEEENSKNCSTEENICEETKPLTVEEKINTADSYQSPQENQLPEMLTATETQAVLNSPEKPDKQVIAEETEQLQTEPSETENMQIDGSCEEPNKLIVVEKTNLLPPDEPSKTENSQINDSPEKVNNLPIVEETKEMAVETCVVENSQINGTSEEANNLLIVEETKQIPVQPCEVEDSQINDQREKTATILPDVQETKQLPVETNGTLPQKRVSFEIDNQLSKKRTLKPRISYAEFYSDDDEPIRSRIRIPSLKINLPNIRPARRKLLNRSHNKRSISKKPLAKISAKKVKRVLKKEEKPTNSKLPKTNSSSNFNDSDDDLPLLSRTRSAPQKKEEVKEHPKEINKITNLRRSFRGQDDSGTENKQIPSLRDIEDSEDELLTKISNKPVSKQDSPVTLPPLKIKKMPSKLPVRKKHLIGYTQRRPSLRIQSKLSRRRSSSTNYFALFLSDSDDEDESARPSKRRSSSDKLWTTRTKLKPIEASKTPVQTITKKRKTRYKRCVSKPARRRLRKKTAPAVKMPILTREDSDQTDLDNIYECATVSTANETDEDASSDHPPKRRRIKVVKPMRIRCVSRRAIPTDVITESSSCSSSATVQTVRKLTADPLSVSDLGTRGRKVKNNSLIKKLLMEKMLNESSSCSSPVMMNKRQRQFAAKSTSKPAFVDHDPVMPKQTSIRKYIEEGNAKRTQRLSYVDNEAIQSHNCFNIEVRLQRLTTHDAVLCRKPCVRLDKNFVENYYANITHESEEELKSGSDGDQSGDEKE